ncbi:MAG: hypothetical protein DI586_04125 [Micavibrio aeruginosavorus]|uniref:Uncharacterized protein n=1 Tax=Micavibrio aeruginosavorus TaxID=349221 RepID=A0A2W5HDY6_9BACT|nr:MAG: hypothetical protein DI586_04125 [Micavibrio aeruginosavorus]
MAAMFLLRDEFISESRCPEGMICLPATMPPQHAAAKAREILLKPQFSAVTISRHYPDLRQIAENTMTSFSGNSVMVHLDEAREHDIFSNEAGQDYLTIVEEFKRDQKFPPVEINTMSIAELIPHFDSFNEPPVSENILYDALPGGIIIIQAQAHSGTGIYCTRELAEAGFAPYYDEVSHWCFDDQGFRQSGPPSPHYVAPGDIVIMRQGDWPSAYPPSIHTSPVCNLGVKDRPACISFGFASPVF